MADLIASIQLLSKNEAWYISNDPLLLDGQYAYSKDLRKIKIGNGTDNWSELPYINMTPTEINDLISGRVANATFAAHEAEQNPHGTTLEDVRAAGNELAGQINMASNRIINLPAPTLQSEPVRKIDFDSYVATVGRQRGEIDCSSNPNYPASNAGDRWEVTAPGKIGGALGVTVQIWDEIVCKTDTAGGDQATAGSDFYIVQGNIERATESTSGYLMLASTTDAEAGTDDEKAMTAFKVKKFWDKLKTMVNTFTETITFSKVPVMSEMAASKFVRTDADKKLQSADIVINDISNSTPIGKAILAIATPGVPNYVRLNADGTVTVLTASQMISALGMLDAYVFGSGGVFNPADGLSYYIGSAQSMSAAPSTTPARRRIYAGTARRIVGIDLQAFTTVSGSAEAITVCIRVNNTTDHVCGTMTWNPGNNNYAIFNNQSLDIQLAANDYYEIKLDVPVMVTNPTGVTTQGTISYRY